MTKRKLYDLVINSLIFNRLYVNSEWYGNLIYWGHAVHISKNALIGDDVQVVVNNRFWRIHKYDS